MTEKMTENLIIIWCPVKARRVYSCPLKEGFNCERCEKISLK